jgi:hypothetical protein
MDAGSDAGVCATRLDRDGGAGIGSLRPVFGFEPGKFD